MKKKALSATGLIAAGLVSGIVLASNGANAETSTATTLPSPTLSNPSHGTPNDALHNDGDFVRSATPIRDDEKALSASDAAKVKAAAEAAVSGGTVFRVETDAGDGKYEAHVAKADGSLVTVKFDENFKVTVVEDGMGQGDPRPAHTAPTSPKVQN